MASFEYTIRFASGVVSFPEVDGGRGSRFSATLQDADIRDESLVDLFYRLGVESFVPIAPHFRHLPESNYDRWGNQVDLIDMTGDYLVYFPRELTRREIADLQAVEGVGHLAPTIPKEFFFTPNDTYFGDQWALENSGQTLSFIKCNSDSVATADYDVDATAAWDEVLEPGCKIGVIDTGIRATHEDLDDSYDPFISVETDNCGHGTAICGVIAAAGDNGKGIAGVARPDKDESDGMLVVIKNVTGCSIDDSLTIAALAAFANLNDFSEVGVVNESFGGFAEKWDYSPAERDAHRNAYVKGLLVVAAAGNTTGCAWSTSDSCFAFPAGFNNFVTAVTGLDQDGFNAFPAFAYNDIAAGSDNIVTTWNSGDDDYMGYDVSTGCGTSLAAPLVTGAASMVLGANSNLTNDDIRAVLLRTAEDLGASGRDNVYGHGQLQLADAIEYVSSPNKVYHGSTSSYSATYLESRTQEFANTPFNSENDTFEDFWVRAYRLEVTASFAAKGANETVIDVWGRPRVSRGFPDDEKIDALLLTSYLEPDPTFSQASTKIYTHTYKVFSAADTTSCLGWYPLAVAGEGACGNSASLPKFDYTFVTEPSSLAQGPVRDELGLRVQIRQVPNGVRVSARGAAGHGPVEFCLVDVAGRVLRREAGGQDDEVAFPTADLPSGIYLAIVRTGEVTASEKITIVK